MNRVAAVDVGTNSVRLLVAEPDGDQLRQLVRQMAVTRLGYGVDATGRLDDGALARTLDVVADYAGCWRELGATRVRITATSAIRDAADRDRFFDGVRARTGVEGEVLSGEEEAATAFAGATRGLAAPAPFLVLDIGGGSTEFIFGSQRPEAATSRQLGCVRVTERCLHHDPPSAAQRRAAIAFIDQEIDGAAAVLGDRQARTLVGVAGTVTTIGALALGLDAYVPERIHGTRVPVDEVTRISDWLAALPAAERARLGPMAPAREDVIVGGALILERVMRRLGHPDVLVSESDILDGLAYGLLFV
jgi:exopolyphosphatase / guanosine-5'-triphosphate,3'-diphosphate pyrophosphatase